METRADHGYEEIRSIAVDILAGRETTSFEPSQIAYLAAGVAQVLARREGAPHRDDRLSSADTETIDEVFWDLFRQGIVRPGLDSSNRELPFFRVTSLGKRILE